MGEVTVSIDTLIGAVSAVMMIVLFGPLAWVVKGLINDQKTLEYEITKHKQYVADECVKKSDHNSDMKDIKQMFHAIFDKLDKKADK